ncbi:MAG: hypothetical protein R3E57_08770 [Porticoccaceae bacterium]
MQIPYVDNPESALNSWLGSAVADRGVLSIRYLFPQYYLEGAPEIELLALFQDRAGQIVFTVGAAGNVHGEAQGFYPREQGFDLGAFCTKHRWPMLSLEQPLQLEPVAIPKPWGQEIWYTGIEQRGLSRVTDGNYSVPLPWVLSVAPGRLAGGKERQINLLKILDPLPEEVFGDLYFELHEEKREVYVVTHVDRDAWPDGLGSIRFGFASEVRSGYDSDDAFKADYLKAVKQYEQVRRQIDGQIDQFRQVEGFETNAPVSAAQLKCWSARLPEQLLAQEADLRRAMNRFTALLPLQVGDVVKVPLLTPHALQHGVRTVEFQTPVYERRIISFAQKVLTQGHWDTEQAVAMMSLETPSLPELKLLETAENYQLEEVVCFDDFRVERLTLKPHAVEGYLLPATDSYALLMSVEGEPLLSEHSFSREEAVLLPARRSSMLLCNPSDTSAIVLLAWPS